MKHFILGTAGHVDHGKSTLIKALTNIDTDRLPEEKERGLSIDLGFAPLRLSGPEAGSEPIELGVVDVPGHQKFLRNMIAGVGGFDAALLVVDCCEGVKPQTVEHLKILQLLQTRRGVVALSKVDKLDEEGIEIARWELEELLLGTFLEKAPIVAVSATDGTGLEELKAKLYEMFRDLEERSPYGVARLPLDRAFSKTGFGDVVTGSLWSGTLKVGDEVEILPNGGKGKVRGLQVHGEKTLEAFPGQRVAVNISGLESDDLGRGQSVVSPPNTLPLGERFAIALTLLESDAKLLQRKFKATFYQGTMHHQPVVNLVAAQESDLEVFGQLAFAEPVLLCRGDRFLLRDETDQVLLGGGSILALEQKPFQRRQSKSLLNRYRTLAGAGPAGQVAQILAEKGGFAKISAVKKQLGLSDGEWEKQLALLLESGKVSKVGKDRLWDSERLEKLAHSVEALLQKLAQAAPWKPGWKAQELASLLAMKSGKDQGFDEVLEVLVESGKLKRTGPLYLPASHQPALGPELDEIAKKLLHILDSEGFSPPDWEQALAEVTGGDKKIIGPLEEFLFGTESLVRLNEKIVCTPQLLQAARETLRLKGAEGFTASEARQYLDTSRKYIIPILEWMDQKDWTLRVGDERKMQS